MNTSPLVDFQYNVPLRIFLVGLVLGASIGGLMGGLAAAGKVK